MSKISIVTPSLNQAKYLKRTIESVLSQGVNLEYIIIDGGSTDGSIKILKQYDSKAQIIVEKDNGQADAIAKGFSIASGEILGWLNSDDLYCPGALKKVINAFEKGHEFITGHAFIIDSNNNILRKRIAIPINFKDLYYGLYILTQESTFFSRRLYLECGGIDITYEYAMDYHLWLRMAMIETPKLIDDALACFRFHRNQKSRNLESYSLEIERARRNLSGAPQITIIKCLRSNISLIARKLFSNLNANGLYITVSDIVNKKVGRLP